MTININFVLLIPKIHFFLKVETVCFLHTLYSGTFKPRLAEQRELEACLRMATEGGEAAGWLVT